MLNFRVLIEKASVETDLKSVDVDFLDSVEAACFAASQIFGLPFTRKDFAVEGIHNSFHRRYRITHKRIAAFWVDVEIVFLEDSPFLSMDWAHKNIDLAGREFYDRYRHGKWRMETKKAA